MKKFRQFGMLLFLLVGIGISIGAVEQQLSLYGKANIPEDLSTIEAQFTPEGFTKLKTLRAQLEAEKLTKQNQTFTQTTYGYQFFYNPTWWKIETQAADVSNRVTFRLDSSLGDASVTLVVDSSDPQNSSLEQLRETVESEYREKGQFVSKELTTIGAQPAYRFLLTETHFGEKTEYEEWWTINSGYLYHITVRYAPLLESQAYALTLLNTLTFFSPQVPPAVKGITSTSKTSYTPVEIAEIVSPSVVNLIHLKCIKMINKDRSDIYLKPEYDFCATGKGTGMIVTEQGYIATNGHVANVYPEQSLIEQVFHAPAHPFMKDLVRDITYRTSFVSLTDQAVESLLEVTQTNPTALNSLMNATMKLLDGGLLEVKNEVTKYYVQLGREAIKIDPHRVNPDMITSAVTPVSSIIEAELVALDFPNRYSPAAQLRNQDGKGTDVAIFKLKDTGSQRFPAVTLGVSSSLKPGEPLVILGFPSLVEGDSRGNSLIDYTNAARTQSVTQGIVSALKHDNTGRLLIQTDASIERGTSGGPAFNSKTEVVGIVTFGVEGTLGNYNFLRDTADIKSLLDTNQIPVQKNPVFEKWREGLTYFRNGYYTKASNNFRLVKQMYPGHPTVDEYISEAKAAIVQGKDRGLFLGFEKEVLIRVVFYTFLFLISSLLVWKLLMAKKNHIVVSSQIRTEV